MNSLNEFYNNYKYFNLIEYKKINKIDDKLSNIEIIKRFIINKKNVLTSIKNFYILYPYFDIIFYKLFYSNLIFNNDMDYLLYYHIKGVIENHYSSLNDYINKYNIDLVFLKNFYNIFSNKTDIEICKILNENNNKYIYSNESFMKEFPDFNINIYKLFNKHIFDNDIKYKSYWYHKGINNNEISSINDFIKHNYLDYSLYKFIYNLNELDEKDIIYWYKNKDKLIYNIDILVKYLDDFNFIFFKKKYPHTLNYNKTKIIEYYIKNINNIKFIYSEKIFYLKYPDFKIEEYKKFNNIDHNNILTEYYFNKNNNIRSINHFYKKYSDFNLVLYKNIYNIHLGHILENDDDYIYYWYNNKDIYSIDDFYELYPTFNLNIYKYFNKNLICNLDNKSILYQFKIKNNTDMIYSFDTFYKNYSKFNLKLYKLFNDLNNYNDDEIIIHFHSIGIPLNLVYNESMINDNQFNIEIYKGLNKDLKNLNDDELIFHWSKYGKNQDRIYSIDTFKKKYFDTNITNAFDIIEWMNSGIYRSLENKDNRIIGRDIVNNIYEVLIDLSYPYSKNKLTSGISLIIRAKNEEYNLKFCIESVVDLVDEIIFVDNNSTDQTYNIMKKYAEKYNKIKLYQYNINVSKVGVEHQQSIKNNDKNTLGTFYNWCLSKATKYNVFKWDADFICIRDNFIQLVNKYNLNVRNDKFAIWFTGKTLFENNNNYYLNYTSFYNEFRIFSYKNNFCWYDGDICEYTEPYLNTCLESKKYKYPYPLFFELKRTSFDEFKERSSLIDNRDIKDFHILNNLKDDKKENLIDININIINSNIKIILYTPSLGLGGGNQFIVNLYKIYKSFGFSTLIIPMNYDKTKIDIYDDIIEEDIYDKITFNIDFIKKKNPTFILFNSSIPFQLNEIKLLSNFTKILFATHSDVAFSNSFIKNFHPYFHKIITVNNYTITKLSDNLHINQNKFLKIINYTDIINKNRNKSINQKKFGIITRFSEDKNIPMLILSLIEVFKKYNDYKIYLVGTESNYYDNYLMYLSKINNLDNNIFFEGYQSNIIKYYEMFDFIILPSVSEGCSYNIIESMKMGIPVITSNVGGNHELIKNNINGIIYDYMEIRNIEKNNIFILDYNEHLSIIGYFINNNYFKNNYVIDNPNDQIVAIVPFYVLCNKHLKNKNNNCDNCKLINLKTNIFNSNLKNITKSIINIIEMDKEKIDKISYNNIDFIDKNFNQYIYINQLLNLINR